MAGPAHWLGNLTRLGAAAGLWRQLAVESPRAAARRARGRTPGSRSPRTGRRRLSGVPDSHRRIPAALRLEIQLPVLADHGKPELAVLRFPHQAESGLLIDVLRRLQRAFSQKNYLSVAGATREADTFVHQALSDTQTPGLRLHQQQPEPGDLIGLSHQKHRAHYFAGAFGDPTPLLMGFEVVNEGGRDLGDHCFETLVPALLPRVEHSVAIDHPTDVAGPVRPQHDGRTALHGSA